MKRIPRVPAALLAGMLGVCCLATTGCGPKGDLQVTNGIGPDAMGIAPTLVELYVGRSGFNLNNNLVEDDPLDFNEGIVFIGIGAREWDIIAFDDSGVRYCMSVIVPIEMSIEALITSDFSC